MRLPRRAFLQLAAGAAVLPGVPRTVRAQAYPSRPVRIIVGFAPGGPTDILGRLVGQRLSERMGQQFIIDHRPGAGSNIATEAVVRAPADGYTLYLSDASPTINATLYDKLSFNFIRDIAPVASISRHPLVIALNPSVPVASGPEFLAYAKANPGKINMSSPGNGTPPHVAGELFKMMTGVNLVHVPYRGASPALTDLIGGQVQVMFAGLAGAIQYVKAGQLRAVAVTGDKRVDVLPDLPTVDEFVPGYEASGWFGLCAPRNTPAEITDKLNKEVNAALADAKLLARLADLGGTALVGSPADFGKLIASETDKWAKVIKFANIRPE